MNEAPERLRLRSSLPSRLTRGRASGEQLLDNRDLDLYYRIFMKTSKLPKLQLFLGCAGTLCAFLLGLSTPACSIDHTAKACESCEPGQWAYLCEVPSSNNTICAWDDAQALAICPEGWSDKHQCSSGTGGAQDYPNWDPDGYVTYNRLQGVYEVDALLIDDIADDSLVLMVRDGARLVEQTGGYFEFERIGHDDLATHLGFQNGDVPQSVNGYPLRTWANYAAAIVDLRTQTSFSIVVERRGSYVTLYYRVV